MKKFVGHLLLILVAAFHNWCHVNGYNMGAPDTACDDMTPQHGQILQTGEAPFTLEPNVTSLFGGERLLLTLKAKDEPFKGFFLQARVKEDDGKPVGQFLLLQQNEHHLVTCKSGFNNAVTHKSSDDKSAVMVAWQAPDNFEGDVIFRGTVVQSYTTYWTNLRTKKVTIKKRSVGGDAQTGETPAAPSPPDATAAEKTAPQTSIQETVSTLYDGCAKSKTCIASPNSCEEKKSCRLMLTYSRKEDGKYEIELLGDGGPNRYVAFGLSFDEKMGEDCVIVCSSTGESVDIYKTWNEGRSNVKIRNAQVGIRKLEGGNFNGKLYCRFLLDQELVVNNRKFDLTNERYHLMVAGATVSNDNNIQYHGPNKVITAGLVSMGATSAGEASVLAVAKDPQLFKILHGSLMILAWICTASCGIILARYFKRTWLNGKCCNKDIWFHFHRFFMILTWSLTLAALVLIWVALKVFNSSYHSIIGMTSVVLCFVQPFMAAIRPPPGGEFRIVFNWLHWLFGNSAQILGITAIFLGYEKFLGDERNWVKEVAWYTLIAFIAFHCFMHLTLSIAQCISDRKPKSAEVFPLKELSNNRILYTDEEVRMDAPHGCFRKFILSIYLIINWAFTALLIILVVFEREDIEHQLKEWNIPEFWENL